MFRKVRLSDIEQREGRILRQGNRNKKVKIFRYITENTFDGYSWQVIENKQKFIGQIMTSKSPVRSCEDMDEVALSYAEVKALVTGNPYIREKMDLDIQVSKLKLLKASHISQHYRLEDNLIERYPKQIAAMKEQIAGYQADIQTYMQNKGSDKNLFCMKVGDKVYIDKKEAGVALLEMCRAAKQANRAVTIGEYRGFSMDFTYDTLFLKFTFNLKGKLSHEVELGADALGNLQRLNHVLEAMPENLKEVEQELANVERQLETAKIEVAKPFAQEQELKEKLERLSKLNALLKLDERGELDLLEETSEIGEQSTDGTESSFEKVGEIQSRSEKTESVVEMQSEREKGGVANTKASVCRISIREKLAERKEKVSLQEKKISEIGKKREKEVML